MIYNVNDILRYQIENLLRKDLYSSIIDFLEWYNIKSFRQKDAIMRLVISDFYKNIYIMKDSEVKTEYLEFIENQDVNSIICYLENDYNLLSNFLYATIKFNNSTFIDKQVLFNKIQNIDNFLMKIYKGHILDKIFYSEKETLEEISYIYIDYITKSTQRQKYKIADSFLCANMLKIKERKYDLYRVYMLEFIKNYYKWKKFLFDNKKNILLEEEIKYLKFIENNGIEEILYALNNNKDFFETIVGEYFYYKTIKITEIIKEMEKFINTNLDYNKKKKFKI